MPVPFPHTPEPWEARWYASGTVRIRANDGHGDLASVLLRRSKTNNVAERNANARLIVAAPRMKRTLLDCHGLLDMFCDGANEPADSSLSLMRKEIRALLAEIDDDPGLPARMADPFPHENAVVAARRELLHGRPKPPRGKKR